MGVTTPGVSPILSFVCVAVIGAAAYGGGDAPLPDTSCRVDRDVAQLAFVSASRDDEPLALSSPDAGVPLRIRSDLVYDRSDPKALAYLPIRGARAVLLMPDGGTREIDLQRAR